MFIIGLTGGIASGKSAVAFELQKLGATVFNVDDATHNLSKPGGEFFKLYVNHFGEQIITENGQLDRRTIREIIFHDATERHWINSVTHPILLNFTRQFLVDCQESGISLVVLEIPLLFEAGWEILVDEVWAVYVSPSVQLWRLTRRDKITPEQAIARINSQMPVKKICARADVVINNQGTREDLRQKILQSLNGRFFSKNYLCNGVTAGE